jgi:acyl-CoA reductase-like NAD-dependent aldehyde dehydrogenase
MSNLPSYRMFIGGEWVAAESGEWFESFDPFAGKPWALVARGAKADVDNAVAAAYSALKGGEWSKLNATQRGALMRRLGDLIARDAEKLAGLEVQDNGKLFAEMGAQVRYLPQWYYYYAGLADKIEGSVIPIDKADTFNFTRHEPIGVVAAITPWNSPLLLATWKLAPALAAGCTVVLKPSEHTSVSALAFCKLIEEAGFPKGVVNVVTGFGPEVGEPLVAHPKVAKVAQYRFRRRRDGRCGQGRDFRNLRGHRPDLYRGLTPARPENHRKAIHRKARRAGGNGAHGQSDES